VYESILIGAIPICFHLIIQE